MQSHMIDWGRHRVVLGWIKENLDGYQFLTPESKTIKRDMEENPLESKEDVKRFGELYEQFLLLVEYNPLTCLDSYGKKAAIIVRDFYYFIYPTIQGVPMPVGLQIEMGSTNTKEKAGKYKSRLEDSLKKWNAEYAQERNNKIRKPDFGIDEGLFYGEILSRPFPVLFYYIKQAVLLFLVLLCMTGNVYIYIKKEYVSFDVLEKFSYIIVSFVTVFFLIKSIIWIIRERKREIYIKLWNAGLNDEMKEGIAKNSFRQESALRDIFNQIEMQSYVKRKTESLISSDQIKNKKEIKLSDLKDKKEKRVLFTVEMMHVFTMLTAAFCFFLYSADAFSDFTQEVKAELVEEINDSFISPFISRPTRNEVTDTLNSVNLKIYVSKDDILCYSDKAGESIEGKYQNGTILNFLGIEKTDDCLRYHIVDEQNMEGYVDVPSARLRDEGSIVPSKIEIYDRAGNPKDTEDINRMFDGYADTSVEVECGDVIKMFFADSTTLRYIYCLNGDLKMSDSGVRLAHIKFNQESPYVITLPKECSTNGYVVPVPEKSITTVEIEITKTMDDETRCFISELILVR